MQTPEREPDRWSAPGAPLADAGTLGRSRTLPRAVLAGFATSIAVVFGLSLALDPLARAFEPSFRGATWAESMAMLPRLGWVYDLVPIVWSLALAAGGFVAARRCGRSPIAASLLLGLCFGVIWALPVWLASTALPPQYALAMVLLLPAALVGGVLGRMATSRGMAEGP